MQLALLNDLNVPIESGAMLCDYTTFRLGGRCPFLISCSTPLQLEETVMALLHQGEKFILIGGGSNLVVSDSGVQCVVIRYFSETPLIQRVGHDLVVSGSTRLDDLAHYAAEEGLAGLNTCHGIPGTVGGAVAGNAGAFGKQVGDVLHAATLLSMKGVKREADNRSLGFSYRHSRLKDTDDIVVLARFQLKRGDRDALLKEREEILAQRREKHPDLAQTPCAGSFFRNIEPTSSAARRQAAGWFLEQAGGKSLRFGGASIFEKHANIIVREPGCTAQDVYELHKKMIALCKETHNLDLVREVRFAGPFRGAAPLNGKVIW